MSHFNPADANTTDGTAPEAEAEAGVEIVVANANPTLSSSNSGVSIQDDNFETELSFGDEENYSSTQAQATELTFMPASFCGVSRSGRNKILCGTATCLFLVAITGTVAVVSKNNRNSMIKNSAAAVNPASGKSSKAPSAKTTKAPKSSGGGGVTTTTTTTTAATPTTTTTTTATTTTTTTTTSCSNNLADYEWVEYGACTDAGHDVHPYIAFDMGDITLANGCKCAEKCNECVRGEVATYRGFTIDTAGPQYTCGCHYDYGDATGANFVVTGSCQTTTDNQYWPSDTGSGPIEPWPAGEQECYKLALD